MSHKTQPRISILSVCWALNSLISDQKLTSKTLRIHEQKFPLRMVPLNLEFSSSGSYGFSEKVFEGIRLEINAVSIKFNSVAFSATLTIQLITIFSARENWTQEKFDIFHRNYFKPKIFKGGCQVFHLLVRPRDHVEAIKL